MYYQNLRCTLSSQSKLVPYENPHKYITDYSKDYYVSLYQYNEEQKKQVDISKSVSGIKETTTDRVYFDFDSKDNLQFAKNDTAKLAHKLVDIYNIPIESIGCYFTGSKGFSLEFKITQRINPQQFKNLVTRLAEEYDTFDTVVNDANRIIRVPNTIHQSGKYYKIPLHLWELEELSIQDILTLAETPRKDLTFQFTPVLLPLDLKQTLDIKSTAVQATGEIVLDFSTKPKGWSNCKWALVQGYQVEGGNRHDKLMCIAATAKALNYPKDMAYYWCKHAQEKGVEIYGGEPWDKEEFYKRDLKSIYSNTWDGGTYSCKDGKHPWLTKLCKTLGHNACKAGDKDIVSTSEVFGLFESYAENYDKNIITTGIPELDERCKFMVGTSNGILAPPGVGKTSLTLGMLNHNSVNQNIDSMFFSYDMYHSLVYLRLLQKHFNINQDEIFNIFRTDKTRMKQMREEIESQYSKVKFCFKSGQTPDEIYETILDAKNSGQNIKLVVIDYNELVMSGVSDPTQASAVVAQRLRQIANDTETCIITLLQPSKVFSNPADEITTYQGAKGSGAIAQSLSLMLSLSRPGFHPRKPQEDRFFTINALKHRQGPLFTVDLGWDGLTGRVYSLPEEQYAELERIREERKLEREQDAKSRN